MNLPSLRNLPVNLFAGCFNNTTATYKFYWLLSILQESEKGVSTISKKCLFARMISNAWYTVNYFHVSFGLLDKIQDTVHFIHETEHISVDENLEKVFQQLVDSTNSGTIQKLWHFNRNVPHRFLSPWFPGSRLGDTAFTPENLIYCT